MYLSSHRFRSEEKKLHRKMLVTFAVILSSIIIFIYIGLPILIKSIVFISTFKKDKSSSTDTTDIMLQSPVLNPIDEATNSAIIQLSGFGEKESYVVIYVNDKQQVKIPTGVDGIFSVDNILLKEGVNSIMAKTFKAEKISSYSATFQVIYKKVKPKLDISAPNDGDKFCCEQKEVTISGTTDSGNKVFINDRVVIVDVQGKFSLPIKLNDGDNLFKISVWDDAGNIEEKEIKVTYTP